MPIIRSPRALVDDLCRFMRCEVPTDTAIRALEAARRSYPEADDRWVVERAAYLIRRKS